MSLRNWDNTNMPAWQVLFWTVVGFFIRHFFLNAVVNAAMRDMDEQIPADTGDYMQRGWLIRDSYHGKPKWWPFDWGIKIQKLYRADNDRHRHNHPASFVSIILQGGYTEEVNHRAELRKMLASFAGTLGQAARKSWFGGVSLSTEPTWLAGSVHKFRHGDTHRITRVIRPYDEKNDPFGNDGKPVITMVLWGRKRSSWGFEVDGEIIDREVYLHPAYQRHLKDGGPLPWHIEFQILQDRNKSYVDRIYASGQSELASKFRTALDAYEQKLCGQHGHLIVHYGNEPNIRGVCEICCADFPMVEQHSVYEIDMTEARRLKRDAEKEISDVLVNKLNELSNLGLVVRGIAIETITTESKNGNEVISHISDVRLDTLLKRDPKKNVS